MQETLQNNTKKEGTGALDLKMFINGEWVNSTSGEKRDVLNPATGSYCQSSGRNTGRCGCSGRGSKICFL